MMMIAANRIQKVRLWLIRPVYHFSHYPVIPSPPPVGPPPASVAVVADLAPVAIRGHLLLGTDDSAEPIEVGTVLLYMY